jgi:3-hydroxyisobutyrate dehydrogenase
MTDHHETSVGFIGLGAMGEPMAYNLIKAGTPLVVWNRSREKCERVVRAGARLGETPEEVLHLCSMTILMLVDGSAIDAILGRGKVGFARSVGGRLIVNMATTEPLFSKDLQDDILAAGGRYVEAPVSGSRKPAEAGQLVAMLAGNLHDLEVVRPLLAPLCRNAVVCGEVPGALQMKLAVNLFLTTVVTGLAESVHFASSHKLDLATLIEVLDASPLASDVSRVKIDKMVSRDFSAQASIANVLTNVDLIVKAARDIGIASPILDACKELFRETSELGLRRDDMAAVIRAIERRTEILQG